MKTLRKFNDPNAIREGYIYLGSAEAQYSDDRSIYTYHAYKNTKNRYFKINTKSDNEPMNIDTGSFNIQLRSWFDREFRFRNEDMI